MDSSPYDEMYMVDDEPSVADMYTPSPRNEPVSVGKQSLNQTGDDESSSSSEECDVEDEEGDSNSLKYDDAEFAHLEVNDDIRHMFERITEFQPRKIDLDTKLLPFIPEFIPAIGDIDAFLKIPRPDGHPDGIGLMVLDEPAPNQSDAGALELKLHQMHKGSAIQTSVRRVKATDSAGLQKWVQSVREIHSGAPAPSVQYNGPVPDIEKLMEEWPVHLQEQLKDFKLPEGPIDVLIDFSCAFLDIPITNRVHALHQLLSLYQSVNETL